MYSAGERGTQSIQTLFHALGKDLFTMAEYSAKHFGGNAAKALHLIRRLMLSPGSRVYVNSNGNLYVYNEHLKLMLNIDGWGGPGTLTPYKRSEDAAMRRMAGGSYGGVIRSYTSAHDALMPAGIDWLLAQLNRPTMGEERHTPQ